MYYQNDERWKHKPINNSKNTIGEVGCLLTSLCNIYNLKHNSELTPSDLNSIFIQNKGYTEGNLIIWAVAEKILGAKIQHIYTGEIEYDLNSFYIVNFPNPVTGHFTNLISKKGNNYNIFDVWNGQKRAINKPRRIVKVTFNE